MGDAAVFVHLGGTTENEPTRAVPARQLRAPPFDPVSDAQRYDKRKGTSTANSWKSDISCSGRMYVPQFRLISFPSRCRNRRSRKPLRISSCMIRIREATAASSRARDSPRARPAALSALEKSSGDSWSSMNRSPRAAPSEKLNSAAFSPEIRTPPPSHDWARRLVA